jgi:hypothetical protein
MAASAGKLSDLSQKLGVAAGKNKRNGHAAAPQVNVQGKCAGKRLDKRRSSRGDAHSPHR